MSTISTEKDGWPKVTERLAMRRFSRTIHLSISLITVVAIMLMALVSQDRQPIPVALGSLTKLFSSEALPEVPAAFAQQAKPPVAKRAKAPSAEKEKPQQPEKLFDELQLLVIAVIAIAGGIQIFNHYLMKQAITEHHSDIDKVIIPERTKCKGDSKAETEENKKKMTDLLETHQIRDYRDTWRLLNRQLSISFISLASPLIAAFIAIFLIKNGVALTLALLALMVVSSLIAFWGLWMSERERRVFPWRAVKTS